MPIEITKHGERNIFVLEFKKKYYFITRGKEKYTKYNSNYVLYNIFYPRFSILLYFFLITKKENTF